MKHEKLLDTLVEIAVRLTSKSPKLFVYIQNAALAVTILFGVLSIAVELQIPLPIWLVKVASWQIAIEAALAYFIAKLPVQDGSGLPLSK